MAATALSAKAVGSIIKLKVNNALKDFIVVHQGKPDTMYDDSCNGTWLLMKDLYESRAWHSSNDNDYANSTIHSYLNSTFLNLFESNIIDQIKQVKIPYRPGSGTSTTCNTGASGLSAKIFLLSCEEVGLSPSYRPTNEGANLSYFTDNNSRIGNLNGSATSWWLRSPNCNSSRGSTYAYSVYTNGDCYFSGCSSPCGIRPALVLPSTLLVSDSGEVATNTAPTISSTSGASGVNLGTKSAPFQFKYTPNDADGDELTVIEKIDGVQVRSLSNQNAGTQITFASLNDAAAFREILNGNHTITVEVSDGEETATFTATFTKAVHSASITLTTPMAVSGDITLAMLGVVGNIPADATYKVEVTNNANDNSPVWQDVTEAVKSGANILFNNTVCANGAAFNFRITVTRGSTAGYISSISGAFQ